MIRDEAHEAGRRVSSSSVKLEGGVDFDDDDDSSLLLHARNRTQRRSPFERLCFIFLYYRDACALVTSCGRAL